MAELVRELEIWVHTLQDRPENNKEIKMEVGVEDALHIEFEYQRSKYVIYRGFQPVTFSNFGSGSTGHTCG